MPYTISISFTVYKLNHLHGNHHSQHAENGAKIARNVEGKEALQEHQDGRFKF